VRPNWINFNKTISKKHHQNTLVSVGRLEKQKNYLNLLKMLSGSNLTLHIYGNGSEKNNLINFSKNNKIDLNIFDVIPNEKLRLNLTKYSIFISNSIFEGNPKTILEAMAAGVCCSGFKYKKIIQK
jgi:glycosyltransferase involved in cell wall biosynthesis